MIKLIRNMFKKPEHDNTLRAGAEVPRSIEERAHAVAIRNAMH